MKFWFCCLVLAASQCAACELGDVGAFRKDLEQAFLSKSFDGIRGRYGDAKLEVTLDNEYDDANPTRVLEFDSISDFAKWFLEHHRFSEHMLLPERASCDERGCKYELPTLTLHHGIYLLGFGRTQVGQCRPLTRVHIHWG